MVNPPREEIRKIRGQLQEYGQVGDANVFYWFQNRKSRSKHKQRQLLTSKSSPAAAPSPSSSSSDKSSSEKSISVGPPSLLNSPTASVNQPFFQASSDLLAESFYFPVQQEFCFPAAAPEHNPNFLLSELMLMSKKKEDEQISYTPPNQAVVPPSFCVPSPSSDDLLQGAEECGGKSTVFINDVCFEVGVGPFNVREAFGEDAVLIQSCGQAVPTDEWGVTLHPLHHGAFYYLLRPFLAAPRID